jgi:hypothetical protein
MPAPITLPRRQAHTESPDDARLAVQTQMCKALLELQPEDAIGVACSLLLYMSHAEPQMIRRVLNEPVVREGFRGTPLIDVLTRVCR